jgi:hypothetical protein
MVPAAPGSEAEGKATVEVESRSRSSLDAFEAIGSFLHLPDNFPQYASAAALLVCLGWLAATVHYKSKLAEQANVIQRISTQAAGTKPLGQKQTPPQSTPVIGTYFLSSGIPTVRGTGNAQETVVSFAPGDSLVMLNLSIPQSTGLFRATLSSFLDEQELLWQNQLKPMKTEKGWVVSVPLPASSVANNTDYLLTLAALDKAGKATPVSRFLFRVQK